MTQFSDEGGTELRQLFFETAQEILQTLNEEALKLEQNPGDAEIIRSIRRGVHTLKGDAAAVGCRELSELAHELENALALDKISSETPLVEIAFTAADVFGAMLSSYRQQASLPSTEPLRQLIRELAAVPVAADKARTAAIASAPVVWTEYEKLALQKALEQGNRAYHIQVQVDPHCAMPIAARQLVMNAIGSAGEVLGSRPEAGSSEGTKEFHLLLASPQSGDYLSTKCRIPTVIASVSVELLEGFEAGSDGRQVASAPTSRVTGQQKESQPSGSAPQSEPAVARPAGTSGANILRVGAERIDDVLNLVGELIIGKSMLQQAINEFAAHYPKDAMRGRFADAIAFQARVLNDLQRAVMKVRMVPVDQLFRRFPRMVRDVARQCGKEVELVISGEDTDLDKSLLDAIAEPLTHLVRNAVSHGIEPAQERVRRGKPATGKIRLDAYHHGNQVVIEIADDGAGINTDKVKARSVERGLITAEESAVLTDADILQLVFRPGLSTADEVTEVSGRGVGLDVVQNVLHRLKGFVEIETRPGQGTTFRLKVPLTLAIIKALLFKVEHRLYAIPLNTVAEIARTTESDLHYVDNCEVLQLRDQVLPAVRLGRRARVGSDRSNARIFVLVISMGERKLGLLVDDLAGEEQLVIKALDNQTVDTDLVSGASILGDGRVVLILNLPAVVDRYSKSRREAAAKADFGMLLSHAERAQAAISQTEVHP